MMRSPGIVYLVGAGPGDPDLITVLGLRCLRRADAVVYDRLVHPALVAEAPATAQRFDAGKAPGSVAMTQAGICRLLVQLARSGRLVVRLKGGDPFVFGRGGEEALALTEAGLPWRVVPGITSAVAAPASAGIPLTHRGIASSFTVVPAHHAAEGDHPADRRNARLDADTVVALMTVRRLGAFVAELLVAGRPPDTPAALVERATWPGSRTVTATLRDLPARAAEAGIRSPATLVVGRVVALRRALGADRQPALPSAFDLLPDRHPATEIVPTRPPAIEVPVS